MSKKQPKPAGNPEDATTTPTAPETVEAPPTAPQEAQTAVGSPATPPEPDELEGSPAEPQEAEPEPLPDPRRAAKEERRALLAELDRVRTHPSIGEAREDVDDARAELARLNERSSLQAALDRAEAHLTLLLKEQAGRIRELEEKLAKVTPR